MSQQAKVSFTVNPVEELIHVRFTIMERDLLNQIFDVREAGLRASLIRLGWTPPADKSADKSAPEDGNPDAICEHPEGRRCPFCAGKEYRKLPEGRAQCVACLLTYLL